MPVQSQAVARVSLVALTLLIVAACSAPAPEPRDDKEEARALGRDTDETVFDDMIQTQDKARAVEGLTLGRKGELDQALEASEGDSASEE